jgi:hypothetical protein
MGFDLSYSLERSIPLSAEELDVLAEHLRRWRGKIINYDWQVPEDATALATGTIAWGSLRPTHGRWNRTDHGGYLMDVIEKVHDALAEVRDLVRDAKLAFADSFGAFAWTSSGFSYRKDAAYPPWLQDADGWVSLATTRGLPTGRDAREAAKAERAARPTTRAAALEALASADRDRLVEIVMSPLNGEVRDLERTAAIELLGKAPDPHVLAVLVERLRSDGFDRAWTRTVFRILAAEPRRCSWATPLLAFDREWPGAGQLFAATIDDDAIPHLARLPATVRWNALVVQALDGIDSDAARAALRMRIDSIVDERAAAHLAVVTSLLAARRATDVRAAVARVAAALDALGAHASWLAHERNAGARALALLTGKRVAQSTVEAGLAALVDYALTDNAFTDNQRARIDPGHRDELWAIEAAWIQRFWPR